MQREGDAIAGHSDEPRAADDSAGPSFALQPGASWNIEYRRLGEPGGWPGTYLDVGHAVDHLRKLAGEHALDLGRVVIVGHSAGGHLAMWAAARARVPTGSSISMATHLPVRGVIDLAGPVDLTANIPGWPQVESAIRALLNGKLPR